MMKRTYCLWILILAGLTGTVYAQQDEQSSLYMFNPLQFNPAYAGSRGTVHAVAVGRFQWVGVNGAPMTQFFSFDLPLRSQSIGLGVHAMHDRIGSRERFSVYADFAFAIRLNKRGHRFAFGVTAGADFNNYDFTGLPINNPNDPIYQNAYSGVSPNFGGGIYYYGDRHFIGVSVPRLLDDDQLSGISGTSITKRHFFITGGYVFHLNSAVDFKPMALVKITPNAPVTFDVNASFYFLKRLWVGAMYRFHEGVGANLAVNATRWMTIGYAFDYPINDLRTNQFGTHEVMLTFDFTGKKRKFISPRYF